MTTLALATICPSTTPSYDGTGKELTPGAKRIKYGGDYETRLARSQNRASSQQFTVSYDSLIIAEAQNLEDWLEDTRGVTAFNITGVDWIDPTVKYVYVKMSRAPKKPAYDTVSIQLERVFA